MNRAAIAVLLLLAIATMPVSDARETFLVLKELDGALEIRGPYYTVKLDPNKGGGISSWRVADGKELLGGPIPSLALNAYTGNFTKGRLTLGATEFPISTLAYMPWRATVVANTSELITISLEPSDGALEDVKPLRVSAIMRFLTWAPWIEYSITFTNPTGSNVVLRGPSGGPELYLIVYTNETERWSGVVVDAGGKALGGARLASGEERLAIALSSASLIYESNKKIGYVAGLSRPSPETVIVGFYRGKVGNATVPNAVTIAIRLLDAYIIRPEQSLTISLRVSYVPYNPVLLLASGLEGAAVVANQTAYLDLLTLGQRNPLEALAEASRTIESLRTQVNNLTRKVAELEGLRSYWENEMKILRDEISGLRSSLSSRNVLTIGLAALAAILGFAGGLIAKRGREIVEVEERARRRRRP